PKEVKTMFLKGFYYISPKVKQRSKPNPVLIAELDPVFDMDSGNPPGLQSPVHLRDQKVALLKESLIAVIVSEVPVGLAVFVLIRERKRRKVHLDSIILECSYLLVAIVMDQTEVLTGEFFPVNVHGPF